MITRINMESTNPTNAGNSTKIFNGIDYFGPPFCDGNENIINCKKNTVTINTLSCRKCYAQIKNEGKRICRTW